MRDISVPKSTIDENTRVKIYDPDTGYDGTASIKDIGLVRATTSPGGGIALSAGDQDIYPVSVAPSAENKLVAVDYLPYLALAENDRYIFGMTTSSEVLRYAKSDGASSTAVAVTACYAGDGITPIVSGFIISAWAWSDYQLVQVRDETSGEFLLYKSVDDLATCGANHPLYDDHKPIARIGWSADKSNAEPSISIMRPWSLVRVKNRMGEDVVVWGQYNNTSGTNTRAHVFQSKDGCRTWECVLELNSGGSLIVRHCHAVQHDPYENEFWFCYGDSLQSAYYVWDGVHPLPANTPASHAGLYRGWRGMDRTNTPTGDTSGQDIQVCTLQFTQNEVIAPVDTGYARRGIYTLSRDLRRYERITSADEIGQIEGHSFFSSAICARTGTMLVSTLIESSATSQTSDYVLWVWAATPAGNYRDWRRVARYMLVTTEDTSRSFSTFMARPDGSFWLGSSRGAGKDYASTSVCRIDGSAIPSTVDDEIDPIHPVYWVDPTAGDDLNSGYSPALPWKTAGNALRSSKCTHGALIHCAPGESLEVSTSGLSIYANPRKAQRNYPAIIRGAGRKATTITVNTIGNGFSHGTVSPYRFERLSCKNLQNGTFFATGALAAETKLEFRDVYVDAKSTFVKAESGIVVIERFESESGTVLFGEYQNSQQVHIAAGVHRGASRMMRWSGGAGSSAVVEHVTGIGQSATLVEVLAAAVTLPTVRNCAESGGAPVVKDSRTVKTSAEGFVEHNAASAASTGLVGGDTGSIVAADLRLIGTTGMPMPDSPLLGAGAASAVISDVNGTPFSAQRNIGAWA